MNNKGFETEVIFNETPEFRNTAEDEPLKQAEKKKVKVDINILKARVQEVQNRENKKNIFIFIFFLITLGALGIFLSI